MHCLHIKKINLDVSIIKKRKLRKNIYTELCRQGFILRLRQVYTELFTSFLLLLSKCLVRLLTLDALQSKRYILPPKQWTVKSGNDITIYEVVCLWRRFAGVKLNRSEHLQTVSLIIVITLTHNQ